MKRFLTFLVMFTLCLTCFAQYYHYYGGRASRRVTYVRTYTRVRHVELPREVIVVHKPQTQVVYEEDQTPMVEQRTTYTTTTPQTINVTQQGKEMWDISVWFEEGKSIIRTDGEVNIKNVYNYLNSHPKATITIYGYVSLKHGTWNQNYPLAKNRVDVVKRKLVEFYGIDRNRITTSVDDFDKHPYPIDSWNQCVIIKYNL